MFYLFKNGVDDSGCEAEECIANDEDRTVLEERATLLKEVLCSGNHSTYVRRIGKMKTYVQYLERGVVTGNLIPACGDRAVVQLDGRNGMCTLHTDAQRFNGYQRPCYPAYQLIRGRSLLSAEPISGVIDL